MARHRSRYPSASILSMIFIIILCLLIGYFSYQLFFSDIGFDHSLARSVITLGIPVVGDQEEYSPGWEYTLRSLIYLLTDYDLGNPDTLLKNTIPLMRQAEQMLISEERPLVFIPELTFAPDPFQPQSQETSQSPGVVSLSLEPQVLIYHTHSSEMYLGQTAAEGNYQNSHYVFSSNHDTKITGIMEVGKHLAQALRSQGIGVIHDTTIHDWPSLSGSYINSERTARRLLEQNPGVRFVFDVHRDAGVPDRVVMIDGKRVARVLLVVATAQDIPQNHPNWRKNYEFAMEFYRLAEQMYPGFMRPVQIRRDARYNQHLHENSIVIEIGSVENTIEEALLAAELVATIIAKML
ncbi:MAG: stage II sporulation protein P [Candidatus Wallacebacter cryptica]|nr:stage II sporulation protein P [Bacillota bacterium]